MRSISQIKALSLLALNARPGRPVTNARDTFKKVPNPDHGKTKRNWMGVCHFCDCKIASGKVEDLRAHAAKCKKATPDAQLEETCARH